MYGRLDELPAGMIARMEEKEITGTAAILVNSQGEYLLHLRDNIPGGRQPDVWSLLLGGGPEHQRSHRTRRSSASCTKKPGSPFVDADGVKVGGGRGKAKQTAGRWLDGKPPCGAPGLADHGEGLLAVARAGRRCRRLYSASARGRRPVPGL